MDSDLHSDQCLYHTTSLENISSILCEGLLPRGPSHREKVEEDLIAVAAENDINLPIDRRDCVFCYPSLSQAATLFVPRPGTTEKDLLGDPEGIVVIDGEQVTNELFLGEFKLITEAITLQYKEHPDEKMLASSYEDALQRYADSLIRISSFATLDSHCGRFEYPEIVVAGEIAPQAIVSVLCDGHPLVEEYQDQGQQ